MSYNPYIQGIQDSGFSSNLSNNDVVVSTISTDIVFSSSSYNSISWTSGVIAVKGGNTYSINAGSAIFSTLNFIYFDGTSILKLTSNPTVSQEANNILIGSCKPSQPGNSSIYKIDGSPNVSLLITADHIQVGLLEAVSIDVNDLVASQIVANGTISGINFESLDYSVLEKSGWRFEQDGLIFYGDSSNLSKFLIEDGKIRMKSTSNSDQSEIIIFPTSIRLVDLNGINGSIRMLYGRPYIANLGTNKVVFGDDVGTLEPVSGSLKYNNNIVPEVESVTLTNEATSFNRSLRIKIGNNYYLIPALKD